MDQSTKKIGLAHIKRTKNWHLKLEDSQIILTSCARHPKQTQALNEKFPMKQKVFSMVKMKITKF